jgi:hypothetical protein
LPRITSISHQENIAEQHNNENVDLHEETSNGASTYDVDVSTSKIELVSRKEKGRFFSTSTDRQGCRLFRMGQMHMQMSALQQF